MCECDTVASLIKSAWSAVEAQPGNDATVQELQRRMALPYTVQYCSTYIGFKRLADTVEFCSLVLPRIFFNLHPTASGNTEA
jgi:hypothetical protein